MGRTTQNACSATTHRRALPQSLHSRPRPIRAAHCARTRCAARARAAGRPCVKGGHAYRRAPSIVAVSESSSEPGSGATGSQPMKAAPKMRALSAEGSRAERGRIGRRQRPLLSAPASPHPGGWGVAPDRLDCAVPGPALPLPSVARSGDLAEPSRVADLERQRSRRADRVGLRWHRRLGRGRSALAVAETQADRCTSGMGRADALATPGVTEAVASGRSTRPVPPDPAFRSALVSASSTRARRRLRPHLQPKP